MFTGKLLFSHSVVFDYLRPHELKYIRLPCPSPSPWVCSNSCPLIQWCHPTISYSVTPFFSCLQSFPVSGSFPMNWLLPLGGPSIWASALPSVFPMNIQGSFPLGLTSLISLLSKRLLKSLLQHHSLKASILWCSAFFMAQLSHLYMNTGKTIALTIWTFVSKVISLLFDMMSRLDIAFLPRSKPVFNFMTAVTICSYFGASLKIKPLTVSIVSPSVLPWSDRTGCQDLRFLNVEF